MSVAVLLRVAADVELPAQDNACLARAVKLEREAERVCRRDSGAEGPAPEAYDAAAAAYVDSGLAFHGRGESALAAEVCRAIKRCRAIAGNLRHPKAKRPAPALPPCKCESCGRKLRRYRFDGQLWRNGKPKVWGDYGDNRFCGLSCGWRWACAHVATKL